MKLDSPKNGNYAATIVSIHTIVELPGLDNLVGIPVLGHQALTQKGIHAGDLRVCFTAETQLSGDFCAINSLYRDETLNKDPQEKGYLDKNRRVRAIKLRGHVSNALLMPLSSLAYTGINLADLTDGDTFDALNGHDVCCKYEIQVKQQHGPKASKVDKAFKRVDSKLFPEHLETDQYHRNKHLFRPGREVVVTQKLHGTSWRGGNVPVLRRKNAFERFLNRFWKTPTYEYDTIFGSRKVIKDPNNPNQNHYYTNDIWTDYGKKVAELIPEGYLVYGELIGFTPEGAPIQKNYTYQLSPGMCELFVYRVAHINAQGYLGDLSWDGVKEFCQSRGLKWCPELTRLPVGNSTWEQDRLTDVEEWLSAAVDAVFHDDWSQCDEGTFNETPLMLSNAKTVDEGVCLRQEGLVPTILKAKSPKFLEHETKLLDKGEVDLESAA